MRDKRSTTQRLTGCFGEALLFVVSFKCVVLLRDAGQHTPCQQKRHECRDHQSIDEPSIHLSAPLSQSHQRQ